MTENKLELALRAAAQDVGRRPAFYKLLLESDVWALGDAQRNARGEVSGLALEHWLDKSGEAILPLFTSLEQLQLSIDADMSFVQLNARAYFEATRGKKVMLNPNADHAKLFTPTEIDALLDGSLFQRGQEETVEAPRRVLLGQPADFPQALADGLASYFGGVPEVQAAYLAMLEDPGRKPSRSWLVGLETQAEAARVREIFGEAGLVVAESLEAKQFVDFVMLDETPFAQSVRANGRRFYPTEE